MDAVTHVPTPPTRPSSTTPPAARAQGDRGGARELASERLDLPHTIGGERVTGTGEESRSASRTPVEGARGDPGSHKGGAAPRSTRHHRRHRLARPGVHRPGRNPPRGGRHPRRPVARRINAATMLGQSKTAYQAEIDAAAADRLLAVQRPLRPADHGEQPPANSRGLWNRSGDRSPRGSCTP